MRLDFDFHGGAGYAVAHRALPVDLPGNYELSFWIRAKAPPNDLEVKLIDSTGDNVWWLDRKNYTYPERWTHYVIRKRQISFAWGPRGGGVLHHAAAIELAITAGTGGRGTVWIDDLTLTPLPPVPAHPLAPQAAASTSMPAHPAVLAVDGDTSTEWHSSASSGAWLALDLRGQREFSGLTIVWDQRNFARDYDVQTSNDNRTWTTAYSVHDGDGGHDFIYVPESESAWIRLVMHRSSRGRGYGVREVIAEPIPWAASLNAFDFAVARAAPRGNFPRAFSDSVQSYWTVIGAPAGRRDALVSQDGAVEVNKGAFSLEPSLFAHGRWITWADVHASQSLARGDLPIPTVHWQAGHRDDPAVTTTAWVGGPADSAVLFVRYRVANREHTSQPATLFVAIRPFQVNPPWQFLNTPGGAAPVRKLMYDGTVVRVNGGHRGGGETVIPVTRPTGFGASSFDAGGVMPHLRHGNIPSAQHAIDTLGRADAVLAYGLRLPPNGHRDVVVAVPFHTARPGHALTDAAANAVATESRSRTRDEWAQREDRVTVTLPPSVAQLARTLRTTQAYILIDQDGPAIQPGTRSYARSWIRDGALISESLLRTGHPDPVRAFLEWYARYQFPNGKVPCCVDHRGADPVPENDSNGEFIYLVREYFRYTSDTTVLATMWPHVQRAVAYLDSLRLSERSTAYLTPGNHLFYGLLPASISHEGYSAKPMHSYWDDFFALRGFKDAAAIAHVLGKDETAVRYTAIADQFRGDLIASINGTMASHHIRFIPGSAELGDFDATSTTIALEPGGEQSHLPAAALAYTFDRYWHLHQQRASGATPWTSFTPYELRAVGSFVRLGKPERSLALLSWFIRYQRPAPWNQWAEVVWHDPATPRFIGDMPHAWVGSDFIRSFLDLFAYDRESDSTLVLGAGIPERWARSTAGVAIRGLRTPYGILDLTEREQGDTAWLKISGTLRPPGSGLIARAPFPRRPRTATVNGVPATLTAGGGVIVHALPSTVRFTY